ncbi:hypothetical protein, partial [Haloferax profundi]|uniref:hypothetical protein n=1 Tax=Haloferax profundi TaxID=1544718 RepID=UPI000A902F9D
KLSVGESTTFDVVIDDADGGINAVSAIVNVTNTSVATVENATVIANGAQSTTDITTTNESVHINATGLETNQTGSVTIATVQIRGVSAGSSNVALDIESLTNESGIEYTVTDESNASVTVSPVLPPVGVSDQPPNDLNGDGLFEDVN